MARVGAKRAAELTGKSKSTIQRAMNSGKISYELDNNGRRVIDVSELERAFGLKQESQQNTSAEHELEKAQTIIEMERLKMRVMMLEEQLETSNARINELIEQRDQWQSQASQVLLTSQHSQKQADEYKAELREWENKAREIRQRKLAQKQKAQKKMKNFEPENENLDDDISDEAFNFKTMWQKTKATS